MNNNSSPRVVKIFDAIHLVRGNIYYFVDVNFLNDINAPIYQARYEETVYQHDHAHYSVTDVSNYTNAATAIRGVNIMELTPKRQQDLIKTILLYSPKDLERQENRTFYYNSFWVFQIQYPQYSPGSRHRRRRSNTRSIKSSYVSRHHHRHKKTPAYIF